MTIRIRIERNINFGGQITMLKTLLESTCLKTPQRNARHAMVAYSDGVEQNDGGQPRCCSRYLHLRLLLILKLQIVIIGRPVLNAEKRLQEAACAQFFDSYIFRFFINLCIKRTYL